MLTLVQSASVRGSAGEPLPEVWRNLTDQGTRFLRGQLALVAAGPGCIAGDAEIVVNRGGNGSRLRLEQLVPLFNGEEIPLERNGKETKGRRSWDPDIDTYVQCEIDGYIRSAKLKNAWCSGVKTTYEVVTETGRRVRATAIHPFLTTEGWKRLEELKPGDKVHVRGSQKKNGRGTKKRYKTIKLANHPFNTGKKRLVAVHRLVAEAELNGLSYEEWVALIRSGESLEGYEFIGPEKHVHHKDNDHLNNDPGNLEILDAMDHWKYHSKEYGSNVLYSVEHEEIISITEHGEEMTYDLELDTEPHNFTANGFVVHNTGKSAFVLSYALKSGVSCLYFSADSDAFVQLSRSLSILGGMNMQESGDLVRSDNYDKIASVVGNSPVRFSYNSSPTLEHIQDQVMAYEELYGDYPELIIVDNALDVVLDADTDQAQSLDQLMAWLHDMARSTEACVIVLHHVTGPYNDAQTPIPLSGVKGQIGRVPELILTLHKGESDFGDGEELRVSTVKNRGQKADPSGNDFAELKFDGYRMQIQDRDASTVTLTNDPWS